jgi:hypothetical protein
MHNRTLTATVRQIHVVALMQQEKHDRARTEIEGNVFSHLRAGVAVQIQFLEASPLISLIPAIVQFRPRRRRSASDQSTLSRIWGKFSKCVMW